MVLDHRTRCCHRMMIRAAGVRRRRCAALPDWAATVVAVTPVWGLVKAAVRYAVVSREVVKNVVGFKNVCRIDRSDPCVPPYEASNGVRRAENVTPRIKVLLFSRVTHRHTVTSMVTGPAPMTLDGVVYLNNCERAQVFYFTWRLLFQARVLKSLECICVAIIDRLQSVPPPFHFQEETEGRMDDFFLRPIKTDSLFGKKKRKKNTHTQR